MADEPTSGFEKAVEGVTRGAVRGSLEAVRDFIFRKRKPSPSDSDDARRVLILGPGGTGKSTLARLLANQVDWLDDVPGDYVESTEVEVLSLSDDPGVEAVVAPGQHFRRASTWPVLLTRVAAGEFHGVIFVSAFGYHTFSTPSYKVHHLYEGSGTKEEFLKAYLADRREEEMRVLRHIAPHLSVCPKKVWLMSVVAKQDLWGSQQREVEEHYLRGAYASVVETITNSLGSQRFRHEPLFVSLTLRKLVTKAGELLQANEAGYDMSRLSDSIRRLIRVVAGLKGWEEGQ